MAQLQPWQQLIKDNNLQPIGEVDQKTGQMQWYNDTQFSQQDAAYQQNLNDPNYGSGSNPIDGDAQVRADLKNMSQQQAPTSGMNAPSSQPNNQSSSADTSSTDVLQNDGIANWVLSMSKGLKDAKGSGQLTQFMAGLGKNTYEVQQQMQEAQRQSRIDANPNDLSNYKDEELQTKSDERNKMYPPDFWGSFFGTPEGQELAKRKMKNMNQFPEEVGKNILSGGLDAGSAILKNSGGFGQATGLNKPLNQAADALSGISNAIGGEGGHQILPSLEQGFNTAGEGVKGLANDFNPFSKDAFSDAKSQDLQGSFNKLIGGGLQMLGSPANLLPEDSKKALASPFKYFGDRFDEWQYNMGLDPHSEQAKNNRASFDNAMQLIPLVLGEGESRGKVSGALDTVLEKGKGLVTKAGDFAMKPITFGKDVTKSGVAFGTGLSPESVDAALSNADALKQARSLGVDVTRDNVFKKVQGAVDGKINDLSEMGKAYRGIRENPNTVVLPKDWMKSKIQEYGLKINDDGRIEAGPSSRIRDKADVGELQQVYDRYGSLRTMDGNIFLNLRHDLDGMSSWQKGTTDAIENFARNTRSDLNTVGRPQVKGLEQLDNTVSPKIEELKKIKNIIYDKSGNLYPDALNRVNNLLGKGKEAKLTAIEDVAPGITQDLKIAKAVQDIEISKGNKIGSYGHALISGGAGLVGGGPLGVAAFVLTHPSVAIPVLEMFGRLTGKSAEFIGKVTKGLKAGIAPAGEAAGFVQDALTKVNHEKLLNLTSANAAEQNPADYFKLAPSASVGADKNQPIPVKGT